jgi:hypothetical protein
VAIPPELRQPCPLPAPPADSALKTQRDWLEYTIELYAAGDGCRRQVDAIDKLDGSSP